MPEVEVQDEKKVEEPDEKVVDKEEPSEPLIEPTPELELDEEEPKKVHPLAPGGKRFEQIYAQNKQTQHELAEEREKRIAAEARLAAYTSPAPKVEAPIEYTPTQLEQFVAEGRITRADAVAHREEALTRKLTQQIKAEFHQETVTANRTQALSSAVDAYLAVAPNAMIVGTPERSKLDAEFDWLASVQGLDADTMTTDKRKSLQLTALRNVYGPIESLTKRNSSQRVETAQGLPGGSPPRQGSSNPDQKLLDSLSAHQVEHYKNMMRNGRYPNGWKDVAAELKYVPKKVK